MPNPKQEHTHYEHSAAQQTVTAIEVGWGAKADRDTFAPEPLFPRGTCRTPTPWIRPLSVVKLYEDRTAPGTLLHNLFGKEEDLMRAYEELRQASRADEGDGTDVEDQPVQQLYEFGSNKVETFLITTKHTKNGDVHTKKHVANFVSHGDPRIGLSAQYWFPASERRANIFRHRVLYRPPWGNPSGPTLYYDGGPFEEPREQYSEIILCVDVDFATLHYRSDVFQLYSSAGGRFGLQVQLEPRQLLCLLQSLGGPPPTRALSWLGRQLDELKDCYVFGNGAVMHDPASGLSRFASHQDVGVVLVPAALRTCHVEYGPEQYPTILNIKETHVRYKMFHGLWSGPESLIGRFFDNNATAMRIIFAFMAMTPHVTDLWARIIPALNGPPCLYVYSPEAGTGKTKAVSFARAVLGQKHDPIQPSNSSEPALYEHLSTGNGTCVILDDLVNDQNTLSLMTKLIRSCHDRTARAVIGKHRRACNTLAITSNHNIALDCSSDSPMATRMLMLMLQKPRRVPDAETGDEFVKALDCLSALFVDLDSITRWKGTLDAAAVKECSSFVALAVDKTLSGLAGVQSRNIAFWGLLLYLTMLLTVAALAEATTDLLPIMAFCVEQAARSAYNERLANEPLHDFLVALAAIMPNGFGTQRAATQGLAQECVHFHNFVTMHAYGQTWFAVHLPTIEQPILAQLNKKFDALDLEKRVRALAPSDDRQKYLRMGSAAFYCIRGGNWPPVVFQDGSNERYPATQAQALASAQQIKEALWISTTYMDRVKQLHITPIAVSVEQLRDVCIPPCTDADTNASEDPAQTSAYSLVSLLEETPSHELPHLFIFRALLNSNYAPFCGASNLCGPCKYDDEVFRETQAFMWEHHKMKISYPDEMFTMKMMLAFYANDWPLPPCYKKHAYAFRDAVPPLDSQPEASPANGPLSPASDTASCVPETPAEQPRSKEAASTVRAIDPAAAPSRQSAPPNSSPRQPSRPSRQRSSPAKHPQPPDGKRTCNGAPRDLGATFAGVDLDAANATNNGENEQTNQQAASAPDRAVGSSRLQARTLSSHCI